MSKTMMKMSKTSLRLLLLSVVHLIVIQGQNNDERLYNSNSCNTSLDASFMLKKMTFRDFSNNVLDDTRCNALMNEFASAVSGFVKCSVLNARPFTVCERCLYFYTNTSDAFQKILSSIDNDSTTCEDRLMNSDKIQVIRQWNDVAQQLWDQSHCSDCFTVAVDDKGHTIFVLSNDTLAFDGYLNKTMECIHNQTDFCKKEQVCKKCLGDYKALNKFYNGLADSVDNLCMDIVDKMNMTRTLWSEHFLCVHHTNPVLFFFLSVLVIASTPVLFYILAWLRSDRQEQFLVPQRRLIKLNVQQSTQFSSTIS